MWWLGLHFSYRCCKSVDLPLFSVFVHLYAGVEFIEGELPLTPLILRLSAVSLYDPGKSKDLLKCKADLVCSSVCWHVCKMTVNKKTCSFLSRFKARKVSVTEVSSAFLHSNNLHVCKFSSGENLLKWSVICYCISELFDIFFHTSTRILGGLQMTSWVEEEKQGKRDKRFNCFPDDTRLELKGRRSASSAGASSSRLLRVEATLPLLLQWYFSVVSRVAKYLSLVWFTSADTPTERNRARKTASTGGISQRVVWRIRNIQAVQGFHWRWSEWGR